MRLFVCGLNPSVYSADAGVGFARPGNRFWPAALAAGIVTTDMRGHITYWSPRAEELLGYRPDDVLGRPVSGYQRGGLESARALMR